MNVKYVHTNLVARDWQRLARFYIDVFGCEPVYPGRDLRGEWLDDLTGLKNAEIKGIHLRLPGYDNGPTLEIFQYGPICEDYITPAINRPGLAHLAFLTDDVGLSLDRLLAGGGSVLGDLVEQEIPGVGMLTVVYARDPEGNIIELQNWRQ